MTGTISSRQAGIIACIMVFANKILTLPSLLYEKSKADAVFVIALLFLLELGVLYVFFRLKRKHPSESFFEILSEMLTKPVAIVIYALFFLYFYFSLLITFNFTHVYFKSQVYHDDQESVFLFVAVAIIITTMARGLRPLARSAEFFFLLIIFGFVAVMFVAFSNTKDALILFDSPILNVFKNIYEYAFAFGDMIFLFLIMDKIELDKKGEKLILKYILFSIFVVLAGYVLFYSVYQYTAFIHPNAVSDIIVLSYQIFNIGRLEFIPVMIVMVQTLLQLSIYSYLQGFLLRNIFKKMTLNFSITIVIFLFLGSYILAFNSLDILEKITKNYVSVVALFLQYGIPLICLFFTFGRGRLKDEKNL